MAPTHVRRLSARLAATILAGLVAIVAPVATSTSAAAAAPYNYLVGTGVYDITGAAAESNMFGYAAGQETDGIQERLWSHAYVIADPVSGRRVVFVSADMGAMFQSVKLEVVRRLQQRYGSTYSNANVMLTATHTHVGSGGMSHYALYQIASADSSLYGYSAQNFEATVNGIVSSIVRAHGNLTPASVTLTTGTLTGATKNRSTTAYNANPDAGSYGSNVNTEMVQLRFTASTGRDLGMINWFPIHPTSLSLKFRELSGDNKGYAQYLFEKAKGTDPLDAQPFVATFANSDEGDVVPVDGNAFSAAGYQGSSNELLNAELAGQKQFDKAWELFGQAGTVLDGSVDFRHRWANFENYSVAGTYTGGAGTQQLCASGLGVSFGAGGENGPSNVPGIYEGMRYGESWSMNTAVSNEQSALLGSAIQSIAGTISWANHDPCQQQKPVLLNTGSLNWVPEVLPFQIFRVGSLAIVAAPSEVTTMAGRRIRATVLAQLSSAGVTKVVIAGLANTYSGYVATKDEYAVQHYEGASTQFGPYTLAAYQQEYDRLATALRTGSSTVDDKQPVNKFGTAFPERIGVVWDSKYLTETFGQALTQPAGAYTRGQTVTATFRGGHPKNNLMTMSSYLYVQRWNGSSWVNYRDDNDWDTTFLWKRDGGDRSICSVTWRTKAADPAGTYRLVQQGYWKNGWDGSLNFYQGASRSFTLS